MTLQGHLRAASLSLCVTQPCPSRPGHPWCLPQENWPAEPGWELDGLTLCIWAIGRWRHPEVSWRGASVGDQGWQAQGLKLRNGPKQSQPGGRGVGRPGSTWPTSSHLCCQLGQHRPCFMFISPLALIQAQPGLSGLTRSGFTPAPDWVSQ